MVPGKTYPLKILAVMKVSAFDSLVFDPEECSREPDKILELILKKNKAINRELFNKVKDREDEYSILALSTCSSEKADERTIVFAAYERK